MLTGNKGNEEFHFSPREKVQCCYWLTEFEFPMTVQCMFYHKYSHQTDTQLAPAFATT